MKIIYVLSFLFVLGFDGYGQDLIVIKDGREIPAQSTDGDEWVFVHDDEVFLILKEADIRTLVKKIELLEAEIEHRDSVIASRERLIEAYDTFQDRADEHIAAQDNIITAADSLFRGYQSLYTDLKQLVAVPRIALTGGVGIVYLEEDIWRPVGMLGIQYHRWQVQYQIGRRYHGLILGFRLPIFY